MSSTEDTSTPHPIAAGDGVADALPRSERHPYELLIELMLVVEELCPVWPERPTFEGHTIYKL